MGSSPSADLYYGILYEEGESPRGSDDFEEQVALKLHNIREPEEEYVRGDERIDKLYSDYWDAQREAYEAVPVHMHRFGYMSGEYTQDVLYIRESHISVIEYSESGFAIPVFKSEWRQTILEFCESMDIEFTEPSWHLTASYG